MLLSFFSLEHQVILVLDATRSVTVVSSLLGENKGDFAGDILEEYNKMQDDYYAGLVDCYFLMFEQTKAAKIKIDFNATLPAPKILSTIVMDTVTIADIVPYID